MNKPYDELFVEIRRIEPSIKAIESQLRNHTRTEEESRFALFTLEDIIVPALKKIEILNALGRREIKTSATEVFGALNFFSTLSRFADERRFPDDIDDRAFSDLIGHASYLAGRCFYP